MADRTKAKDFVMREIGISIPYRFNETEKLSKVKQEILLNPSKEHKLAMEVGLLTDLVRQLSKRVEELEKSK